MCNSLVFSELWLFAESDNKITIDMISVCPVQTVPVHVSPSLARRLEPAGRQLAYTAASIKIKELHFPKTEKLSYSNVMLVSKPFSHL